MKAAEMMVPLREAVTRAYNPPPKRRPNRKPLTVTLVNNGMVKPRGGEVNWDKQKNIGLGGAKMGLSAKAARSKSKKGSKAQ